MAEALGVVAEKEVGEAETTENIFLIEAPKKIEELREVEPEQDVEIEKPELPHFNDTADHFEGMVVFEDGGNVVDYIGNFGSMRAACEANPAGAPIEKVLGLYREVISKNGAPVAREFQNPDNASQKIVHTLTRVGYDRIEISITHEAAHAEVQKNSRKLSPAELSEKVSVEAAWKIAAAPHVEISHEERTPEKVVSISEARKVAEARASGISLEGFAAIPLAPAELPRAEAHVLAMQPTVYGAAPEETTYPTPAASAVDALRALRSAA